MKSFKRTAAIAAAALVGVVVLAGVALAIFAATFDANRYKPMAVDWVQSRYGRTLAIDGPIELSVFPRLALGVTKASLSEPRSTARFAEVADARVALEVWPLLRGEVRASRVTARGVRLAWSRDAQGRSNIDDLLGAGTPPAGAPGADSAASGGTVPSLDIAGVDLQDVEVEVKDATAGAQGTVSIASFQAGRIAPGVETPVELKAALRFAQPAVQGSLEGDTRVRLVPPAAPGAGAMTVELGASRLAYTGEAMGLRFSEAEIRLGGTRHVPAERRVEVAGLELALEVTAPGLPSQSLDLQGSASGSPRQLGWNLAGQWRAPGNVGTLKTDGRYLLESGTVEAKADLGSLDFDALRREPGKPPAARERETRDAQDRQREAHSAAPAPSAQAPAAAAGDAPIDLTPATALRGRLELGLGKLVAENIVFTDLRATLRGDGRTLVVEPFSARVWDGRIEGRAEAQPAARRVRLAATASDVRIEQALRDLSGRENVTGRGRLELDLTTAGATASQWRRQLGGRAAVQLRDAAVKGFNLAALGRQAKAALALRTDDIQKAKATEQTDFSEITASFAIAEGVARNKDLMGKSPYLRVTGEGAIDLVRSSLDYTARATLTDTSKGQGGAELAALNGIEVPVRLTGPLADVQYQVVWSAVGGAVAREAVKQKIQEKLGMEGASSKDTRDALREKAKEKLKGLFK